MSLKRLSRKIFALACILAITSSAFQIFRLSPVEAEEDANWHHEFTREELAYRWAPVWYQDINDAFKRGDYITKFDYDGNWIGNDNWDNIHDFPLNGYVYYSVVETYTHWFLGYYDFHPRDWSASEISAAQHENDLEGVLIVVSKDSSTWGTFFRMVTAAHWWLYPYNTATFYPFEDVGHPVAFVEDSGHGVYGGKDWDSSGFPGGDGVIYLPSGVCSGAYLQ
jgi:hypothetical protein